MRTKLTHALAVTAAAMLALPALAFAGGAEMKEPGTGGTGALSDPEIAAVVVAANEVDIKGGELAKDKATNPEVKQFAEKMITDHESLNKQTKELAKKLKVDPKESTLSRKLKSDGKAMEDRLGKLEGDAFDRAYIANEVQYHTAVIDTVKNQLMPNAKNPELKALLEKATPILQEHLEHAKRLQQSMQGVGGTGADEGMK